MFFIGAAMLIGCGIVYVLFADADLQCWNTPKQSNAGDKEMQPLKKKSDDEKARLNEEEKQCDSK